MSETPQHPDIEIYIKQRPISAIESWLGTLGELSQAFSQGAVHEYTLTVSGVQIPVMVHEKVAGKAWTSIWFKSDQTPWAVDLDCARVAAVALDTQVRCIASGWNTGDDPDEWWKIDQDEETLIQWLSN